MYFYIQIIWVKNFHDTWSAWMDALAVVSRIVLPWGLVGRRLTGRALRPWLCGVLPTGCKRVRTQSAMCLAAIPKTLSCDQFKSYKWNASVLEHVTCNTMATRTCFSLHQVFDLHCLNWTFQKERYDSYINRNSPVPISSIDTVVVHCHVYQHGQWQCLILSVNISIHHSVSSSVLPFTVITTFQYFS